jgi:hypothetical protein
MYKQVQKEVLRRKQIKEANLKKTKLILYDYRFIPEYQKQGE